MPGPSFNTNYNGLTVDAALASKLKQHPSSEFLSFDNHENGTVTIQAKFPEMGRSELGDFRIRENMNYFLRGFAKSCFDENGVFDVAKSTQLSSDLYTDLDDEMVTLQDQFISDCGVPEDQQEDFRRFVSTCHELLQEMLLQFDHEISALQGFQLAIHKIMQSGEYGEITDEYRMVSDSYKDYLNTLAKYSQMANMDPRTETGILQGIDCMQNGTWNKEFLDLNNQYRKQYRQPEIQGEAHVIEFSKEYMDDETQNKYRKFDTHVCFVLNTEVDNEPMILSLEATAPPAGKLMFCPENVRTGVGLYEDTVSLDAYHKEDPFVVIPNNELFRELCEPKTGEVKEVQKITPSSDFLTPYQIENVLREEQEAYDALSEEEKAQKSEKIDETLAMEKTRDDAMKEQIDSLVSQRPDAKIEGHRVTAKVMLDQFAAAYTKEVTGDATLGGILDDIKAYAEMNATSVRGDYEGEAALYDKIYHELKEHFNELDEKQRGVVENEEVIYDPEDENNRKNYLIAANMLNYFESRRDGDLLPPDNPEECVLIDGRSYPMTFHGRADAFANVSDRPLFPHEPNPNDINQGDLGNCYLLAALSSLSETAPQKIRDSIRDNGDGTVTVRFFTQKMNQETGKSAGTIPLYVTVDKKIPDGRGSENCLWVQMIERAYVASGLHLGSYKYAKPIPSKEELDREYQLLAALPKEERPGHIECPWLIDKMGNLHPWRPDYDDIESGRSEHFLPQLLGEDVAPKRISLTREEKERKEPQANEAIGYMISHACLELLGDNATEADHAFADKGPYDSATVSRMVFRALRPNEDVPLRNGKFNTKASAVTNACQEFTAQLDQIARLVSNGSNLTPEEMRPVLKQSVEKLLLYIDPSKELKGDVDEILGMAYRKGMSSPNTIPDDGQQPNPRQFFEGTLAPLLGKYTEDALEMFKPYEPYSANYLKYMNKAYESIKTNIPTGNPVFAGTSAGSDKNSIHGIYYGHAYSILDVTEKKMAGKNLKFVVLRNPHGRMGRTYEEKDGKITCKEYPDAPGGVFEMELGDFCQTFEDYGFATIGGNAPEAQLPSVPGNILNEKTATNYEKALQSIFGKLDTTLKDSPEFRKLYSKVKEFVKEDYLTWSLGERVASQGSKLDVAELMTDCNKYLDYCTKTPKPGARRETRIRQAKNIRTFIRSLEKGYTDPKDCLGEKLLEKMVGNNKKYQSLDQAQKDLNLTRFLESPQFTHWKKSMTFDDMASLAEKTIPEILNNYKTVVVDHFAGEAEREGSRTAERSRGSGGADMRGVEAGIAGKQEAPAGLTL